MSDSVKSAFSKFDDLVNTKPDETKSARASRDWLKTQIQKISTDNNAFPNTAPKFNMDFGSFARRTKIITVDDVDLMIGLNGSGAYFTSFGGENSLRIVVTDNANLKQFCDEPTLLTGNNRHLNSRKVLSRLKTELSKIPQYDKADIKYTQQAVTMKLSTKAWNFDIVPCFQTETVNNENCFLIPDGKGNWMKTDPRVDQARATNANKKLSGSALQLIRYVKFWNLSRSMPKIGSYLLESIIISRIERLPSEYSLPPRYFFPVAMSAIVSMIKGAIADPKGFVGNINHIEPEVAQKIYEKAYADIEKSEAALDLEGDGKDSQAIAKWREIFGPYFSS